MESLGVSRSPEYQAVVVVDFDDGRLFPLTDECPKCLLPIANRKLLAYQLDLLSKSGAHEIYIVSPREYQTPLTQFWSEYSQSCSTRVEFIWLDDMIGTADGLRAVSDRIRGDFLCVGSDLLCHIPFGELAQMHRLRHSDVTMLLASAPYEESDKKGAAKKMRIDEEDQEYIGLCEDGRVLMKKPALEIDEKVTISKPLLHRCTSSLTVRNDVQDMGVYFLARWVIDYLVANKSVSSLRTELIPFLVERQFQSAEYLYSTIPALRGRASTLSGMDRWLCDVERKSQSNVTWTEESKTPSSGNNKELADYLYSDISMSLSCSTSSLSATGTTTMSKTMKTPSVPMRNKFLFGTPGMGDTGGCSQAVAHSGSSAGESDAADTDMLRCFAIMYERKGAAGAHGAQDRYRELDPLHLMQRVTNITTYLILNRDLPLHVPTAATPWPLIEGYLKKEQSVVGEGCEVGEKVTMKQCSIGKGCKLGAKSKLNNCVLMDNVVIGEGCTIQNSVISSDTVIESNCNINECNIGHKAKIAAGSKIKSEAISESR